MEMVKSTGEATASQQQVAGDRADVGAEVTATQDLSTEDPTVVIGSQNEWKVTLPLSAVDDFLATERQRSAIGSTALDQIFAENPANRRLGFARLRDEVKKRTGINDAAATLILYAREDELNKSA